MKKVYDFLKDLGLSEAETKIYVRLLELGQCSITELAHNLVMNRITVHFNVQNLINMGLITHVKQGRSRELTAQPPETLQYLIEQKQTQVKRLQEQYQSSLSMMTGLMPSGNKPHSKFDVKFFQGINGVRAIYKDVLKANEACAYVKVSSIGSLFPENIALFSDVNHRNLSLKEIIEDSPSSREYVKTMDPTRYAYKFFPSDWNISVFDYIIFGGKIAMIAGAQDPNGIIIINDDLYQNAKVLFEMLWNLLPTPKI
jgi:sugar-specific transcriptional regulator TrmB